MFNLRINIIPKKYIIYIHLKSALIESYFLILTEAVQLFAVGVQYIARVMT
jgi:hypothetical protein